MLISKAGQLHLIQFALCAAMVLGCGRAHPTVVQVSALPEATRRAVEQNLQNNRLPRPGEVGDSLVPLASNSCETFKGKIPADWQQGLLEVPEDPAVPAGAKIHVFYYGKISADSSPVVFFNGGPGSDSHGSFQGLTRAQPLFDPQAKLSFVYLDQRGTGCSDFYPQGNTPDVLARLRHYGSRGIVADAEQIRIKLIGAQPWKAFGQSYGGFIVHRYAIVAPGSLTGAYAHANTLNSDGYQRIKLRIASQARVMEAFLNQYPDDRTPLQGLKAYLKVDKCFANPSDSNQTSCGQSIIEIIASSLLGFNDQWLTIHQWIHLMSPAAGPSDTGIGRFLATFYFSTSNPLNSKRWANRVIGWVDRNVPSFDGFQCKRIREDLRAEGLELDTVLSHECMSALQQLGANPIDSTLPVHDLARDLMAPADLLATLIAHPTLQFHLYSGQKDPYVPVESFAEELGVMGTSCPGFHYTHFLGTGHDGFKTEPQVWQDLLGS